MSPNTIDSSEYAYSVRVSGADIDAMVSGYLECQLWAGLDYCHARCTDPACKREDTEHPHPWDEHYSVDDISPEYVQAVRDELTEVVAQHPLAVRMYLTGNRKGGARQRSNGAFGHDFYLTREGHGAGFWDRGLGELGDYLTRVAKSYGGAAEIFDNGNGRLKGETK